MSEPKMISPLLDNYIVGDPISEHHGIRCCPAMDKETEEKYIVKIISVPASQRQLDALLLTGAYSNAECASLYFKELAEGIEQELQTLQQLSKLEGFLPVKGWQTVPMDPPNTGYEIYVLTDYKRTLERQLNREPMTHLGAINLGLDLCSALCVARRSGYLYVDLKPANIFLTGDREYRVGDVGFMRMDSLKFASMPGQYRSSYTAPEIADAFSTLNTTLDTYALGLILYQCYNNGELPSPSDVNGSEPFPAPQYADYEMAEIILKACDPDPEKRWQDPVQLAQALVSYMQRNGANDTPITPPVIVVNEETALITEELFEDPEIAENGQPGEQEAADSTNAASMTAEETEIASEADEPPECPEREPDAQEQDPETPSEYAEDDFGNLTFLIDADDETAQELDDVIEYEEVSEEVSEILNQADELAAHPVPEPVVAPEAVEIPVPDVLYLPDPEEMHESKEDTGASETENTDASSADERPEETKDAENTADPEEDSDNTMSDSEIAEKADCEEEDDEDGYDPPVKVKHWGRNLVIALLIIGLLVAGYFFYQNYYLQDVAAVELSSEGNSLTVHIVSDADPSDLYVTCSAYGNKIIARCDPSGNAKFDNLLPDTEYKVEIGIDGFHKLTGQTSVPHFTASTTSIQWGDCITGYSDGSVIISFTPDSLDVASWTAICYDNGTQVASVQTTNYSVTLEGLTVGKEYTVALVPDSDTVLTGDNTVTFTANALISAQNITITQLRDGELTVQWDAPEGTNVSGWTVHCFNQDNSYNETETTSGTSMTFKIPDATQSYTVEIKADKQKVYETFVIDANTSVVESIDLSPAANGTVSVSWTVASSSPAAGWVLTYRNVASGAVYNLDCATNAATIDNLVPGVTYEISLSSADGSMVIAESCDYTVPEADSFSASIAGVEVSTQQISMHLCTTAQITAYDPATETGPVTFQAGDSAAFYTMLSEEGRPASQETIRVLYVIYNDQGTVVSSNARNCTWDSIFSAETGIGMLEIPSIPSIAGEYTISVYFNNGIVTNQAFTVTE